MALNVNQGLVELKKDGRTYEMRANHLKATNIGLVFGVSLYL